MISPVTIQSLVTLRRLIEESQHPQLAALLTALLAAGEHVFRVAAVVMAKAENKPALIEMRSIGPAVQQTIDKSEHRMVYRSLSTISEVGSVHKAQLDELAVGLGDQLLSAVDAFAHQYEQYLQSRNPANAMQVVTGAFTLRTALHRAGGAVEAATHATPFAQQAPDGWADVRVHLGAPADADAVAANLKAINAIYLELSELSNISVKDYPLILRGYATGTQWFEFLGSAFVTSLMIPLLGKGLRWVAAHAGRDGRRESLAKDVTLAEKVLALRESMKQAGRPTAEIDAHMDKAVVKIAKAFDTMSIDEDPIIEVDGVIVEPSPSEVKALPAKRRFLKPGEDA
jgi:hypothetical protein